VRWGNSKGEGLWNGEAVRWDMAENTAKGGAKASAAENWYRIKVKLMKLWEG
jgi:hypothetical protein